jgi:hypothetical protein
MRVLEPAASQREDDDRRIHGLSERLAELVCVTTARKPAVVREYEDLRRNVALLFQNVLQACGVKVSRNQRKANTGLFHQKYAR